MENEALVLDLVEWVAGGPRPYTEVMAAWRTSCPRLTIWEDALDAGLLRRDGSTVQVTDRGLEYLSAHGRVGRSTGSDAATRSAMAGR